MQNILQNQRPEAAYFLTQDGKRTALLILNLEDASQMAEFAEPWFLALNAEAYWSPVMVPSDLEKAAAAVAKAVKNYDGAPGTRMEKGKIRAAEAIVLSNWRCSRRLGHLPVDECS